MNLLGVNTSSIESKELRAALDSYLNVGDWVILKTASQLERYPDYFPKK